MPQALGFSSTEHQCRSDITLEARIRAALKLFYSSPLARKKGGEEGGEVGSSERITNTNYYNVKRKFNLHV